jgi:hypothetical protein
VGQEVGWDKAVSNGRRPTTSASKEMVGRRSLRDLVPSMKERLSSLAVQKNVDGVSAHSSSPSASVVGSPPTPWLAGWSSRVPPHSSEPEAEDGWSSVELRAGPTSIHAQPSIRDRSACERRHERKIRGTPPFTLTNVTVKRRATGTTSGSSRKSCLPTGWLCPAPSRTSLAFADLDAIYSGR